MTPKLPLAAITDELTPDLAAAVDAMAAIGMTGAELRVISGKNILDLSDAELDRAIETVHAKGLEIVSIASPLLKVVLPDSPPVDSRFQQDIFACKHTFADQPRLTERAFEIAKRAGAKIIRVFSFWRVVEPEKVFDRVVAALADLADKAAKEDLIIGLENEQACNIATAAEAAKALAALDHPNLKLVWDPANALVSGEDPFPGGYRLLPAGRIVHVHAKDCHMEGPCQFQWGVVGCCDIDWKGQIAALLADGYRGCVSLETHWPGPNGDKFRGSVMCGWSLKDLLMPRQSVVAGAVPTTMA
jgi:L-ribulose-5-phosphate 3-epimerase